MPYEDRNHDHDETMQRINRANAVAGGLAALPEQWADIVALGDEFNQSMFLNLPYDDDPVAKRIAGHMVKDHINAWDAAGKQLIYEGLCPKAEATLYVLDYMGHPAYVTLLRNIEQLSEIKAELLTGHFRCSAPVNRHCSLRVNGMNAEYPVEFVAVKRGDYICAFIACLNCLEHIKTGAGFNQDYIGPEEDWVDTREANVDPFNWNGDGAF